MRAGNSPPHTLHRRRNGLDRLVMALRLATFNFGDVKKRPRHGLENVRLQTFDAAPSSVAEGQAVQKPTGRTCLGSLAPDHRQRLPRRVASASGRQSRLTVLASIEGLACPFPQSGMLAIPRQRQVRSASGLLSDLLLSRPACRSLQNEGVGLIDRPPAWPCAIREHLRATRQVH